MIASIFFIAFLARYPVLPRAANVERAFSPMPFSFRRWVDIRNISFGLCFGYGLPRPEQYCVDVRAMRPCDAIRVSAKASWCKSAARDLLAAGSGVDDDSAAIARQRNVDDGGATAAARGGAWPAGTL